MIGMTPIKIWWVVYEFSLSKSGTQMKIQNPFGELSAFPDLLANVLEVYVVDDQISYVQNYIIRVTLKGVFISKSLSK